MKTFFNKNLGLLYDACQIVTCKTARHDTWIGKFVFPGSESEDFRFIENTVKSLKDISPKLLILGYRNRKQGSLLEQLLSEYISTCIDSLTLKGFIEYVTNENRLTQRIAEFFLDTDSADDALRSISKSPYSADVKTYLYEYFIFPSKFSELIKSDLTTLIREIDGYYSDHIQDLEDCIGSYNYDAACSLISESINRELDHYYSFSLISKYASFCGSTNEQNWIIVGTEYSKVAKNEDFLSVDIASYGNAFGDKIRVKIMQLINDNGEMTLADLAKNINVVNTIAIYHIDILKKENLLLQRQVGRKVLYSLNRAQINKGLMKLEDLCNGNLQIE